MHGTGPTCNWSDKTHLIDTSMVRHIVGPTTWWRVFVPTPHWSDNCWNTSTKVCCFLRDMLKRKNSRKNVQLSKTGFMAYSVVFVNSVIPISLYFPILTEKTKIPSLPIYNWQYEPARLPLIFRKILGMSSSPVIKVQIKSKKSIFGPF